MTPKTLIAAAISAALAVPFAASADENATTWPDKAQPTGKVLPRKGRRMSRSDEAMSGTSAAARGSTRPYTYDPVPRPDAARPLPGPDQSPNGRAAAGR